MAAINATRLLADLHKLRSFGAHETGVIRPSLSPIDLEARQWLKAQMEDAGLNASIDGVGNVFGRSRNPGPALLIGSHSDTQPRGGWLDGAMGVIYALEVCRALSESDATRHLSVDAVAWIDEEGTYLSCLGSRAYCGLVSDDEIASARNQDGRSLSDAWTVAGLSGEADPIPENRYCGYLEAHIEQGGYLEQAKHRIGVVTHIVGSKNYRIRFTGQQNHAGTTPMALRRDAGMALVQFASCLNERMSAIAGPRTVWTIGRVDFDPGTASIIPGKSEMLFQFRDPDANRLETLAKAVATLVEESNTHGPVHVDAALSSPPIAPSTMNPAFADQIANAAAEHAPDQWQRMPSAAIHDAMFLAQRMPAAMMFVPSINGISHDFAEDTSENDLVLGCQVFATAAAAILANAAT